MRLPLWPGRPSPFFKGQKQCVEDFERARHLLSGHKDVGQRAVLRCEQPSLVGLPAFEKSLRPQCKGMGDFRCDYDLWRDLAGQFLEFWRSLSLT